MRETMQASSKPRLDLAERVLPRPLLDAIKHAFAQGITDTWLVGGTALAGFYAGHRRSDDIDLFTKNETSFQAAVLALRSLKKIGASVEEVLRTRQYFKANVLFSGYAFTVDVVEDTNLFQVGKCVLIEGMIAVADLETLFMTKAATLVSRCGEKDLYDLIWLLENLPGKTVADLIAAGSRIDAGVSAESLILSVSGTVPAVSACDFSTDPNIGAKAVCAEILKFQKDLLVQLSLHLKNEPALPLKKLVAKAKRFMR